MVCVCVHCSECVFTVCVCVCVHCSECVCFHGVCVCSLLRVCFHGVCVCVCVCSLLRVRFHGLCVCVCVCVHVDGLNAEHKFRVWVTIHGRLSLSYISVLKYIMQYNTMLIVS